jgi:hypothetical protein
MELLQEKKICGLIIVNNRIKYAGNQTIGLSGLSFLVFCVLPGFPSKNP